MHFWDKKDKFFMLAPMAGFSNVVTREIFMRYGATACVTEFVYSRAVLVRAKAVLDKIQISESSRPCGIQIFGADPNEMSEAALLLENEFSPDFIDINFGCPAPNAVDAGAGSALLKDVSLMCKIVETCVKKLRKTPVTAKLRLGWGKSSIIVPKAAKELEAAGAQMLVLHGRTKLQGYSSFADWDLIEHTAENIKIPLIGNGSVELLKTQDLQKSACKGFMIGRAALGNPWIFANMQRRLEGLPEIQTSLQDRLSLVKEFAEKISSGVHRGICADKMLHARPQLMCYLKGHAGLKNLRFALSKVNTLDEFNNLISKFNDELL